MRPILGFWLAASAALAQTAVLKHSFDTDTEGWMVLGNNGSVNVSKDAKAGAGALGFSYSLDGKGASTASLPAGAGRLTEMRRLRFWVKSDHDTALAVVLAEKKPGGGDYAAVVWAPKNVWQQVDLGLGDFTANDAANDPVDADGKLDPEQVEAVGLLDLTAFFNQMPDAAPMVVAKATGMHTLLVDDFEVLGASAVPKVAKPGAIVIDSFDAGPLRWMSLGGVSLSLAAGDNPLNAPAMAASLKGVDGKLTIILRRVNGSELAGAKRLVFDLAAEHEGTFAVSIETKKPGSPGGQGPRYTFPIYPPEGRKIFRVNVSLADFEYDENSPEDPAGQLEASRIKTISIGDVTALAGGVAADNKIWIGRVEMLK